MTDGNAAGTIDPAAIAMLERVGGRTLLLKMVALFLEDAPRRLARAQSSAATGDAYGVAQACHALKSSAGQLGALRLRDACEQAEILAESRQGDFVALVNSVVREFEVARRSLEALRDGPA